MDHPPFVHYGCGHSAAEGWQNFDVSPTLRFEKVPVVGRFLGKNKQRFPKSVSYGDIVRGLPVADGSCKAAYCSHVLEHLTLYDLRTALRNTRKVLVSGGVFRLVVPDLEGYIREYLDDPSEGAAVFFNDETGTGLGRKSRPKGIVPSVMEMFGTPHHLWMWDYKGLAKELRDAGFVSIRRAQHGDAEEPAFERVEDPVRWNLALGIQCIAP